MSGKVVEHIVDEIDMNEAYEQLKSCDSSKFALIILGKKEDHIELGKPLFVLVEMFQGLVESVELFTSYDLAKDTYTAWTGIDFEDYKEDDSIIPEDYEGSTIFEINKMNKSLKGDVNSNGEEVQSAGQESDNKGNDGAVR